MSENVLVLIGQLKVFGVLMFAGFAAYKVKLINSENTDNMSVILSRLILPMMIATSVGSSSREGIMSMGVFIVAVFIVYCIGMAAAYLNGRLLRVDKNMRAVHTVSGGYSNSGFFAAPITISMFGETAALAFAAYTVVDTVFVWVGAPIMLDTERKGVKINWKKMLNPVVMAAIVGFIILMLKLPVTDNVVWNTISAVGSTSKYFACMYIGADVARKGFKIMVKYPKVFGAVFSKLIVYPALAALVIGALHILDSTLLTILTIYCSSPTMVVIAMLARQANANDEYVASSIVLSSVLCLFTMPFVMWLISMVLY